MRTTVAGRDFSILAEFLEDGAYVAPDNGTVTYTIADNTGADMGSYTDVAVSVTAGKTSVPITTPQAANTVASGKDFEFRTLTLRYEVDGIVHYDAYHYRVVAKQPFAAHPKDVRTYLGVSAAELADDEIDLYAAYLTVADRVGSSDFDTALQGGNLKAFQANKAVVYQAAKVLASSMPMRIAQAQQSDGSSFKRYDNVDWSLMERRASRDLGEAIAGITGETVDPLPLLTTTSSTDPITGA